MLSMSVNTTNAATTVNTDVRGYHDYDVSIIREMAVESSPPSFTSEWESG
tara:strand:+ start:91 stop:240 length:150 start_codon:yes stop_codon:yes gene_type:complete